MRPILHAVELAAGFALLAVQEAFLLIKIKLLRTKLSQPRLINLNKKYMKLNKLSKSKFT